MARTFNGSSDLVTVDAAREFANAQTASASMWVNGAAQTDKRFYSEGINSVNNQWSIGSQAVAPNNKCRLLIVNASVTKLDNTGSAVVMDSTWHHIAVTFDASRNWARYVDGVADGSGTYTASAFTTNRAAIGCLRRNTNTFFFGGSIEEVATWNRVLSAAEVAGLAAGLPASHLGPDHYWPLWGADSPEPDIGNVTRTLGTLTGTGSANGARVTSGLLAFN